MEFKRNYSSNIHQPETKQNLLIQPLLNIAKASTPVRTRVVKPNSQINSTPVNVHKIINIKKSATPTNKENDHANTQPQTRNYKLAQHHINVSPILALNRKLTEGTNQDTRPLTPNTFKRQQSLVDILRSSKNSNAVSQNDPSENKPFAETLQFRTSNSFKTLIESRCKTPTQQSAKQNNQSGCLRSSIATNSFFSGVKKLKESKCSKLSESRSFDQLLSLGNSKIRESDILCSNEHKQNLLAKYKVVKLNDEEDGELLVYCSKCAIGLVNQNFKVEELTSEDRQYLKMRKGYRSPTHNQKAFTPYTKYFEQAKTKLKTKQQSIKLQKQKGCSQYDRDLQSIDSYYNSIITMIEEQRVRDREEVIKARDEKKRQIEKLEQRVEKGYREIEGMSRGYGKNLRDLEKYENLLSEKCKFPEKTIQINEDIQERFDQFAELLESEIKLTFSSQQTYHQPLPSDNALRFSFQKMLAIKQKNQISKYQGFMNTLEEAEEEMEGQSMYDDEQQQKKAFRTLFPEGQSQQGNTDLYSPTFKQF